jgi:hypothetical protein
MLQFLSLLLLLALTVYAQIPFSIDGGLEA